MDLTECKNKGLVKETRPDRNLLDSLIKSSSKKIKTVDLIELNSDSAASKISLAYDALRELLEALAIDKGFKIYNHECYSSFLKEILNESQIAVKFDSLRKIRNNLNYYGKEIEIEEAKSVLKEIKDLIKKIKTKSPC